MRWSQKHGRTGLPWQTGRTPYRVWISEIMLQQTQVSTVIPYFERFIKRFSTIEELALATEDEVLQLWSGLGYYRRARLLHATAKKIVHEYGGVFPSSLQELSDLPGIGRSTAGAILSLGFNQKGSILDANVKRVLARFHGIDDPLTQGSTEKTLWTWAESHTPEACHAAYTQALMDFGATWCTKNHPKCLDCPLQTACMAYKSDKVAEIPQTGRRIKHKAETLDFLIIKDGNGRYLLERRPAEGIWASLWLPIRLLKHKSVTETLLELQLSDSKIQTSINLNPFTYTLSHRKYHVTASLVCLATGYTPHDIDERQRWFHLEELANLATPRLTTKLLDMDSVGTVLS